LCCFLAKTRSIAVPADLEAQLSTLFSKSQIVQKHSRLWISAGKSRVDTAQQLNQDYRNIIEGLQVIFSNNPMHISHVFNALGYKKVDFILLIA
jgi:3-phosphoglycerate kinase